MRLGTALLAAALTGVAALASTTAGRGGGYVEFFVVLTAGALVVALSAAVGNDALTRVARGVVLAWDASVLWALALLLQFDHIGLSAAPGGRPEDFLGVPVVAFHVAAAYGGAVLVTLSAFGRPRSSALAAGDSLRHGP